ncbi:MAG: hypothetical protein K2G61_02440, partial [Bacteroidaceae bacterium]|nr:hypothetical protein [Bacteroidaceae bacterium]
CLWCFKSMWMFWAKHVHLFQKHVHVFLKRVDVFQERLGVNYFLDARFLFVHRLPIPILPCRKTPEFGFNTRQNGN